MAILIKVHGNLQSTLRNSAPNTAPSHPSGTAARRDDVRERNPLEDRDQY